MTAIVTAGCAVGPAYYRPVAPCCVRPTRSKRPTVGSVRSRPTNRAAASWWEMFGDDRLNALEEELIGVEPGSQGGRGKVS